MATEQQILTALVDALDDITGLKAVPFPIPNMPSPVALPLLSQELDDSWGAPQAGPIDARILVLARWGANGLDGARALSDYCGYDGSKSIYQALRNTHTSSGALGGVVQSLRFIDVQEPRSYVMPDNSQWWGRAIRLRIHPKGLNS